MTFKRLLILMLISGVVMLAGSQVYAAPPAVEQSDLLNSSTLSVAQYDILDSALLSPLLSVNAQTNSRQAAASCTDPFNFDPNFLEACKCDHKPDSLTMRYLGNGPVNIRANNYSGGTFNNVNTGDLIVITDGGDDFDSNTKFYINGSAAEEIHTSCSAPLFPGRLSNKIGDDKQDQTGELFEVVTYSSNGQNPQQIGYKGSCTLSDLGDRVFQDTDESGLPDGSGEAGIPNVTVELFGGSCALDGSLYPSSERIDETTTDNNGNYSFPNLMPGKYCVQVNNNTVPVNVASTTPNPLSAAINRTDQNQCDFGYNDTNEAAVVVEKDQVTSDPIQSGQQVVYRITVRNTGDSTLTNVPLKDLYDASKLQFISATVFPSSTTGGVITWDDITTGVGDITPNGSASIDVTFTALASTSGTRAPAQSLSDAALLTPLLLNAGLPSASTRAANAASCTAPFNFNADALEECECDDRPDSLTMRYLGNGPVNIKAGKDANNPYAGGTFNNVNTGDVIVITDGGDEFESNTKFFINNSAAEEIHTSCSASLFPGRLSNTIGSDKQDQTGTLFEVVTYSSNGQTPTQIGFKGSCTLSDIGNRVFQDLDGSGLPDGGNEPGLSNVQVELYGGSCPMNGTLPSSARIGTTTTDGNGNYSFPNQMPGKYCVAVNDSSVPSLYDANTSNPVNAALNQNGGDQNQCDFGYGFAGTGQIGDTVFYDNNGNGNQEANDQPLSGVPVSLFQGTCANPSNAPLRSAETNSNGKYLFDQLPAGNFCVVVSPPAGLSGTTQEPRNVNLSDGESDLTNDFGYRAQETGKTCDYAVVSGATDSVGDVAPTASDSACTPIEGGPQLFTLGDRVFNDLDRDGIQDGNENGVSGVTVELFDNANCAGSAIANQATNSSGLYSFTDQPAGTYCVKFSNIPSGFVVSPANQGLNDSADSDGIDIGGQMAQIPNITLNADDPTNDLGINQPAQQNFSLGDRVFNDTDQDGIQDNGESGVNGVLVELFGNANCTGSAIANRTTDSSGNYNFANQPAGTYCVKFSNIPAGFVVSPANQGGNDATDSDGIDVGGQMAQIPNITLNANDPTNDLGIYSPQTGGGSIDIELYKNASVETATIGEHFNFSVTLFNRGPDPATGVNVRDLIPSCVELIQAYPGQGSYSGDIWTVGTVGVNQAPSISFLVRAAQNGTCTNVAEVISHNETDVDSTPNNNVLSEDDQDDATVQVGGGNPTFTLGDRVFNDTDRDGVQDAGEPGVGGIFVELFDNGTCSGSAVANTTTSGGIYNFGGLNAGTYCVKFSNIPNGFVVSPANQGGNDATDSDGVDVGGQMAQIQNINLTDDDPTNDLGINQPAQQTYTIGDLVFNDLDRDGIQDGGEPGVGGIFVELFDNATCSGSSVANTVTSNGSYSFSGLNAGTYCVKFSNIPNGFVVSPANQGGNDALDSDGVDVGGQMAQIQNISVTSNDPTNDLGINQPAQQTFSLGDRVFNDTDRDGIQDGGEPGVDGVLVELFTNGACSGSAVANQTTSGGNYSFSGLNAGTYCVKFSNIPSGFVVSPANQGGNDALDSDGVDVGGQMAQIQNINLSADDPTNDLGINRPPVAGNIDIELYKNATVETVNVGDTFNFNITLYNRGPNAATNVTVRDVLPSCVELIGAYPGAGTYSGNTWTVGTVGVNAAPSIGFYVRATQAGTCTNVGEVITHNEQDVDSTPGNNVPSEDDQDNASVTVTGGTPTYTVGDRVFNDTDQDGIQDAGEAGVNNVTVRIYDDPNCGGSPRATTLTSGNGNYSFSGLEAGDYCVQFENLPSGSQVSPANQGGNDATDSDGVDIGGNRARISNILVNADDPTNDLGIYTPVQPRYTLGDTVFNDADQDGIQDGGESGVSGVTVRLYPDASCGSNAIGTTVTNGIGRYTFTGLPAGTYCVQFENIPAGFVVSPANQGGNDALDSDGVDIGGQRARISNINLSADDPTNDLGIYQPTAPTYTLGDRVFNDTNKNGIQNAGEVGVSGVLVELFGNGTCSGSAIANQTTSNGTYNFSGLNAGTYCVKFSNIPAGFVVSPANQGGNDAADSDGVNIGGQMAQISNINLSADDPTNDLGIYKPQTGGGSIDIELYKDATVETINVGEDFNFTLTLYNRGPETATNVQVRDLLPSCVSLNGAFPGQGTYSNGIWNAGNINVNGSASLSFWVKAISGGTCKNVAEVIAHNETDVDSSPNNDDGDQSEDDEDSAQVIVNGGNNRFTLGDKVFMDDDADGIQDPNEPGDPGITVQLFNNGNCSGTAIGTTVTDSNGFYSFGDLLAGTYCIEFSDIPPGCDVSPANQGGDDTKDSDAINLGNGRARIPNISLNGDDTTQDLGVYLVSNNPKAIINASPLSGNAPLTVNFDGYNSIAFDGATLTNFHWSFGDGTTGNGIAIQHTYNNPGTYLVKLTVTDSRGGQGEKTVTITVTGNGGGNNACTTGGLLREVFTNVSGTAVADLLASGSFPNSPNQTTTLLTFEAPENVADNYGTRIRGYIVPPTTGNYTFWIASDDASQLWLSSNDSAANAVQIASVTQWTSPRQYDWYAEQQSVPVNLVAGQKYYVEVLHKEGVQGDHVSVAWQTPNAARSVIPQSGLCPFVPAGVAPTVVLHAKPTQGTAPLTVTFNGNDSSDSDGNIVAYQWSFGNGATASGSTASYTYNTPGSYEARLTITDNDGNSASSTQTITVNSGGGNASCTTNGLTWEYWDTIYANDINSGLLSDPRYPNNPTATLTTDRFEAPTNYADWYGARMRGYIVPPVTGSYTFWIASDDQTSLRLSSSDNPANAVEIAKVDSWTWQYQWETFATQKSSPVTLQAGQLYYVEVLHEEGGGGDHVAVAWTPPGGSRQVIAREYTCAFGSTRTADVDGRGALATGSPLVNSNLAQSFPLSLYDDATLLMANHGNLRSRGLAMNLTVGQMIADGTVISAEFINQATQLYLDARSVATPELRDWMDSAWTVVDLAAYEGQSADSAWQQIDTAAVPTAITLMPTTTQSSSMLTVLAVALGMLLLTVAVARRDE